MEAPKKFKIFNLDLHVSVIEDIKDICQRIQGDRIEITNWSISGHNWVFNKPNIFVDIINPLTWKQINTEMIRSFQEKQDGFLQGFDAFIVTHTPVFAMLFEKYNKPILVINTCRQDQPFCWTKDIDMKHKLNESLQRMVSTKQMTILSNNLADANQLKKNTGINSQVIPSLCLYTNATYQPQKKGFIVQGEKQTFPDHSLLLEKPSKAYTWQELQEYQGIVHEPYEMSTMSIFEQYWAGVPLFFPTKEFYLQCIIENKMSIISDQEKWGQPNHIHEITEWLNAADFQIQPYINQYSSMEDLIHKLENFSDPVRENRMEWVKKASKKVVERWEQILTELFKLA